jgi:hypothetical protein
MPKEDFGFRIRISGALWTIAHSDAGAQCIRNLKSEIRNPPVHAFHADRSWAAAGAAPLARADDFRVGLRLWYRQPAPDWNEALPIGAGRLGAMIFGGVAEERLQLNENTLYSDEPGRRDLPLDIAPGIRSRHSNVASRRIRRERRNSSAASGAAAPSPATSR